MEILKSEAAGIPGGGGRSRPQIDGRFRRTDASPSLVRSLRRNEPIAPSFSPFHLPLFRFSAFEFPAYLSPSIDTYRGYRF